MSDEEVIRALLVLARKLGVENRLVVAIQHGIGNREEVTEEQALCLAFGTYGQVRLCCTYGKDHPGMCSWERAMIGKSACIAATKIGASGEWLCQRPSGHVGEHRATAPDGVRWAWGDAPRELTPSERAADLIDYATARLTSDSPEIRCGAVNASQNPVMAGQVCALLRGHEGSHEATVNGQRWVFGAHEPRTMLMCDAKSRGESHDTAGRTCQLMTGHDGPHGARGAFGLMVAWMPDDPTRRTP